MIDTNKIVECAQAHLQGSDLFVVECNCSVMNDVELIIDSETKVTIDKCIELTRLIEGEFDRDVEDFSLTVASAGIGSPLCDIRQYRKIVGSSVEVLLSDGIKIVAKLIAVDDDGMELEYEQRVEVVNPSGKKKKVSQSVERRVRFDEVKYTKEYLDFK